MAANLITQLVCVSGVNKLSSVSVRLFISGIVADRYVLETIASVVSINQPCAHHTQSN
jgi:hypothetical protein